MRVGAPLLVLAAGAAAASLLFPRDVRLDADADWRAASQGLRRSVRPGLLVATGAALVHFHDVRGGIEAVELVLSSPPSREPARVEVRHGERRFAELVVGAQPQRVIVPGDGSAPSIDVGVWPRAEGGERLLVHEIVLRRGEGGGWLRFLPGLGGLAVLLFLRRRGDAPGSTVFALAAVAVSAGALAAALDPVGLWPLRAGTRAWIQAAAAGAVVAAAVARADVRGAAPLGILGAVLVLYAPTVGYGLVYDDFLWTRPWSLSEVASTFAGSEDPTGVSNSYYRPWASTSHALDYRVWGFRPAAFHGTNLALAAAAALAAWALFRRLPVTPRAALAGTLVWILHPMSASAVAWMSQRTDTILAILYLGALAALVATPFRPAVALALGLLALGAKEHAATLPLAGALLLSCLPADADRARRWRAVRGLALVVALYAVAWVAMFPEKLVTRTGAAGGWGGFDPSRPVDWLRLLPALYGPLVLPTGYPQWWSTMLRGWSPAYLVAVAVATTGLVWLLTRQAEAATRRLTWAFAVWPVLMILPLLGLRGIDLYRGGLMLALAAGGLAMIAAHRLSERHGLLPAALAGLLVTTLAPITSEAAAAWGPGGFYRSMTQASIRDMPTWLARLQPHCRDAYWAQVTHDRHMAGDE